jgi:hypothetical protein
MENDDMFHYKAGTPVLLFERKKILGTLFYDFVPDFVTSTKDLSFENGSGTEHHYLSRDTLFGLTVSKYATLLKIFLPQIVTIKEQIFVADRKNLGNLSEYLPADYLSPRMKMATDKDLCDGIIRGEFILVLPSRGRFCN